MTPAIGRLPGEQVFRGSVVEEIHEEALSAIESLHVGQKCQGSMVNLTTMHTTTGARKTSFILMSITDPA